MPTAPPGVEGEPSDEHNGYRIIAAVSINRSRWTENCRLILRRETDGALYGCDYARGLTENQPDEYPWGGAEWSADVDRYVGGGEVPCYPVVAKTITKTAYWRR